MIGRDRRFAASCQCTPVVSDERSACDEDLATRFDTVEALTQGRRSRRPIAHAPSSRTRVDSSRRVIAQILGLLPRT